MRARVEQVDLPGIGVRHDVVTAEGRRVSVVTHRAGGRELVLCGRDDPDTAADQVTLTDAEAEALAEVLGASLLLGQLAGLRDQAAGLVTERLPVPADSPYAGRPLGDARFRTRTGASVVAVLRDGRVIASPGPADQLLAGDVLVVVGTRDGVDGLARIVADG